MDTAQPRFTYDVGGARFMIYPSAGVASGSHDQLGSSSAILPGQ
jgi:hypothetical protein